MEAALDLDIDVVELAPFVPAPLTRAQLRETKFRGDSWLPDEIDALKRLFAADASMEEIAAATGRAFHAVRTQVTRLGLRRNSHRPWTDLEDAELIRRYGDDATASIAQDLGRGCSGVYQRAAILGLSEGRAPPFTDWEDAQVRAGYAAGVPVAQIAALIGRSLQAVVNRAFYHLRIKHVHAPAAWSQEELNRAVELAAEGCTNRQIMTALEQEGFPPRTLAATKRMMTQVVEGRGWGRIWTSDEDEILRRAYATGESLTPIRHRLGRTRCAIRSRAAWLGLQGTHKNRDGWRTEPAWTPAEDALLREHYGKLKGKALAKLIGRKVGGVYNRANVLDLDSGWCRAFSDDEKRAIQIAWRQGLGLPDLAAAMDRDVSVVMRHATRILGLRFNDPARPRKPTKHRGKTRPTLAEILSLETPVAAPGLDPPTLGALLSPMSDASVATLLEQPATWVTEQRQTLRAAA